MANTVGLMYEDELRKAKGEIERLQRDLKDWQDLSEAYRADAKRLAASLTEAVTYADVAAQMEGMPSGKQCKRLTATVIGKDPIDAVVFDVSGARAILADAEKSLQLPAPPS